MLSGGHLWQNGWEHVRPTGHGPQFRGLTPSFQRAPGTRTSLGEQHFVATKIRLMRLGKIRAPYYRIVVADSRTKREGRVIETIGKYHPKQEPSLIEVDSERARYWLSVGAQPTEPVAAILKLTGDWQAHKGEPSENTVQTAAPREDRKAVFEAAAKETLEADKPAKKTAAKKAPAKKAAASKTDETSEAASAEAAATETAAPEAAAAEAPAADEAAAEAPAAPAAATAEAPAAEAPAAEAPAAEAPAAEAPAAEAPAADAPAEETPAEAPAAEEAAE
jgi:small subunit ribosomal protein S16